MKKIRLLQIKAVFDLGIPILGICYGMQLITHLNGGKVEKAESREFGKAILEVLDDKNPLLSDIPKNFKHMDEPQ